MKKQFRTKKDSRGRVVYSKKTGKPIRYPISSKKSKTSSINLDKAIDTWYAKSKNDKERLFTAERTSYGYWTVVYSPTGAWLGRYSEAKAKKLAEEYNRDFDRKHEYVGKKIGFYDDKGKLIKTRTVVAVNDEPKNYKRGSIVLLLDDGKKIFTLKKYLRFIE